MTRARRLTHLAALALGVLIGYAAGVAACGGWRCDDDCQECKWRDHGG